MKERKKGRKKDIKKQTNAQTDTKKKEIQIDRLKQRSGKGSIMYLSEENFV